MKEIERKYLVKMDVKSILSKEKIFDSKLIKQFYAFGLRFRKIDDQYVITYKSKPTGISRTEIEKSIPKFVFNFVHWIKKPVTITKNRHYIQLNNHVLELDEFLDENEGLILAEIELTGPDEIVYDLPSWIGKDVSTDIRYTNYYLFSKPYKVWNYE